MPYLMMLPFAFANVASVVKWSLLAIWPALAIVPLGDERAAAEDRPAMQATRQVEALPDGACSVG